eukprot:4664654-Prymnesium_polylepis.2
MELSGGNPVTVFDLVMLDLTSKCELPAIMGQCKTIDAIKAISKTTDCLAIHGLLQIVQTTTWRPDSAIKDIARDSASLPDLSADILKSNHLAGFFGKF